MKSGLKIPDNPVFYHLLAAIIGTQCQVYCPETQWPFMIPQEVFCQKCVEWSHLRRQQAG